jgi:putative copper export protein
MISTALAALFESPAKTEYLLARAADYLGTALFFGGCGFIAFLWPAGARVLAARRVLVVGWLLGLFGTVSAIGLEGAWAGQLPPGQAVDPTVITQVLGLDFGREWVAKALLWVLAGVVLADLLRRCEQAATSLAWRVGAGAIGLGVLRITGLTGHSGDTTYTAVAEVADLVHLAGMTLWVGGLAVLLFGVLPRRDPDELAQLVPRYSKLAMGSVLAVIAAGTVMAAQLLHGWGALFDTTYGELLLTKIVLLVVILFAAMASKGWVTHRLDFAVVLRGDSVTIRPFVLSVAVETALVLLVLVVASVLVTANPGQ